MVAPAWADSKADIRTGGEAIRFKLFDPVRSALHFSRLAGRAAIVLVKFGTATFPSLVDGISLILGNNHKRCFLGKSQAFKGDEENFGHKV
jgi:hypothetical protein